MLDLLYGFTGIAFAWLVLGLLLLPAGGMLEMLLEKYVTYATKGDVGFPNIFRKFWCKWIITPSGATTKGWAEKRGLDIPITILTFLGWVFGVFGTLHHSIGRGDLEPTAAIVKMFFGNYVYIGEWLAPLLLFIFVVTAPTIITRKLFDLKQRFFTHVKDKDAHKAGEKV